MIRIMHDFNDINVGTEILHGWSDINEMAMHSHIRDQRKHGAQCIYIHMGV